MILECRTCGWRTPDHGRQAVLASLDHAEQTDHDQFVGVEVAS